MTTIIYMDQDMRLIQPKHKNHEADRAAFCAGANVGEVIDNPLTPVIYSAAG